MLYGLIGDKSPPTEGFSRGLLAGFDDSLLTEPHDRSIKSGHPENILDVPKVPGKSGNGVLQSLPRSSARQREGGSPIQDAKARVKAAASE